MIHIESMRVLIVDDKESMCKTIRNMMRTIEFGQSFRFAANGLEAWNIIQKESVDLAVVDWHMPEMTGVELLNLIREDKSRRDMPVLMISAEANREIVAEAAESDIDAYLLKPFTVKSLENRISNIIEKANNPPPMFFHLRMARDFEESGDLQAAIEEIKQAMEVEPDSTRPLRELGRIYLQRNDFETAEKWLNEAITKNKLDAIAFHHLGDLHMKKGNIEKAAEYFDEAMNISPRHVSRGVQFGQVLIKNGMPQRARSVFDKAIMLSDSSLTLQEEIADFCMQEGVNDYASKLMVGILDLMPNREDIIYKLGVANENLGDPKKALEYFIAAGKQDTDNIDIQLKIAKNYIDSGQIIRAEQIVDKVLEKDPENKDARALLKHSL